jgi:hypothetical protein
MVLIVNWYWAFSCWTRVADFLCTGIPVEWCGSLWSFAPALVGSCSLAEWLFLALSLVWWGWSPYFGCSNLKLCVYIYRLGDVLSWMISRCDSLVSHVVLVSSVWVGVRVVCNYWGFCGVFTVVDRVMVDLGLLRRSGQLCILAEKC